MLAEIGVTRKRLHVYRGQTPRTGRHLTEELSSSPRCGLTAGGISTAEAGSAGGGCVIGKP